MKNYSRFPIFSSLIVLIILGTLDLSYAQSGQVILTRNFEFTPAEVNSWTGNRAEPDNWQSTSFGGRDNVLEVTIDGSSVDNQTFYRTEGVNRANSPSTMAEVELYLDSNWQNTPVRAGFWVEGENSPSEDYDSWGIIEFATGSNFGIASNATTTTGFRIWDSIGEGGWQQTGIDITGLWDTWVTLRVELNLDQQRYDYYINDTFVGSFNWAGDEDILQTGDIIFNQYDYNHETEEGELEDGYSLGAYTTYWSNLNLTFSSTSIQTAVDVAEVGETIEIGEGEYAENVTIDKANIEINGESGAKILVGAGETGINITASDVTIQGIEIIGPYDQPFTDIDWDAEPGQTYGIGLRPDATGATISNNKIINIRSGIQVLEGAVDAIITDNYIENTKGSILLRSDVNTISGNSIGTVGNEWDVIILVSLWDEEPAVLTILPNQDNSAAYGSAVMTLSENNGGMTILDRRFGEGNRSHVIIEEGFSPGPEDDFDLGNGLGNPRQPYGAIQHGITAVVNGGMINVVAGTYAPFQVPFSGPANITIEGEEGVEIALVEPTTPNRIVDLRADGTTFRGFTITGGENGDSYVGISISGQSTTASDNLITGVLTGIQATTQYLEGNNEITNNTITNSSYGISLQNNSNEVTGNTINVDDEGLGIGSKTNTITGNDLTIGNNGIQLQTYSGGSLPGAEIDLSTVFSNNAFNRALLVTDGLNPVVQTIFGNIPDAIDAVSSGQTVEIKPGTYSLASTLSITTSGISIIGSDRNSVTVNANEIGNTNAIEVDAENITLSEFTLAGPEATGGADSQRYGIRVRPGSHGLSISNVTIQDAGRSGIDIHSANNLTLSNLNVIDNGGVGIGLRNSTNATISNINASGNSWGGLGLWAPSGEELSDITVLNSTFSGHDEAPGIFVQYNGTFSNIQISDNVISENQVGFYVEDREEFGTPDVSAFTLRGNEFSDNATADIANEGYGDLNAISNWWDSADGPGEGDIEGNIITTGWCVDANCNETEPIAVGVEGSFNTIQAAIDNAGEGDKIHVFPGDYSEQIAYEGTSLGLLIDKSLTIQGVSEEGEIITDWQDIQATVISGAESWWGTNFYVTAADVSITGLEFEAVSADTDSESPATTINKAFEIIADNFVLEHSTIAAASGYDYDGASSSALYFGDEDPDDMTSFTLNDNNIHGGITITNGAGDGDESVDFTITDNTLSGNHFLRVRGVVDNVAWLNASAHIPTTITGNDVSGVSNYILQVWGNDTEEQIDADFISSLIDDNTLGIYAYALDEESKLSFFDYTEYDGSAPAFFLYKSIQSAIDSAEAGNTVMVGPGEYAENIIIDESLSLLGANAGIKPNTSARSNESTINNDGSISIIGSASDVKIDGFEFTDTEGAVAYEHGAILLPPREDGGTVGGSPFNTFENITISNNWFHDLSARPILKDCFATYDGFNISNNLIEDVIEDEEGDGRSGIKIQSRCQPGSVSTGLTITGNEIYNTTYAGIIIDGVDRATISNNTIDNVPEHGINLGASHNGNGEVTIIGNKISNAGLPGGTAALRIKGGTYNGPLQVLLNSFTDSRRGIIVEDEAVLVGDTEIEVHNNIFSNNESAGIVNSSDTRVDATNNWWGDNSGPGGDINDPVTDFSATGDGDDLSGNIAFDPFVGVKPKPAAATVSESFIASPGGDPISFNTDNYTTAVSLDIQAGNGDPLNLSVMRFQDPPSNIEGITGNASSYRWVFEVSGLNDETFETNIRFNLADIPNHGISNPDNIVIYKRDEPGEGAFTALPTTYDSETSELIVTVTGFSEFVMGSDSELLGAASMNIAGNEGWRIMSSPAENASYKTLLDTLWTQGFPGADYEEGNSNVYTWDEANQEFVSISSASDIPSSGTGFIVYVFDDDNYDGDLDGFPKNLQTDSTLNTGTISPALSYTNAGVVDSIGWNLMGNPYEGTIDWDASSGWTRLNLDVPIYIWSDSANGGLGDYLTWNGEVGSLENGLIAPWQGFWVKANAATPEITFTEDILSTGGVFRKKNPVPELRFTISDRRVSNSAIVMLDEQAIVEKDRLDAYELQSLNGDYLTLFTKLDDGSALDINALPVELEEPVSFDLDIHRGGSQSAQHAYKLYWDTQALPEGWIFTLTDNQTGQEIDLNQRSSINIELASAQSSKVFRKTIPSGETLENSGGNNKLYVPGHSVVAPKVMKTTSGTAARFTLNITSKQAVDNERLTDIPQVVELHQNYPNPFNPTTTIEYGVPDAGEVSMEVFNMLGQNVATLINRENKAAGRYSVQFDAGRLASGLYLYRLNAGKTVITKKLTLIK